MISMREKMARALCARSAELNRKATPNAAHVEPTGLAWRLYLTYADAALDALLEPTEGMQRAAAEVLYDYGPEAYLAGYSDTDDKDLQREFHDWLEPVHKPWRAGIRAALEGK